MIASGGRFIMHVMIPGHVIVMALTKGVMDLTIPYWNCKDKQEGS
jgi:hypothetical protein